MQTLIKNASIVNEGLVRMCDVLIEDKFIARIDDSLPAKNGYEVIEAQGLYLLPGLIDTHVHCREPGFRQKASIASESRAAIAGGVTTFFDMPNTVPNTLSGAEIEFKVALAKQHSFCNFGFRLGITAGTLQQAIIVEHPSICGLTDDGLYFDNPNSLLCNKTDALEFLFSSTKRVVALHCEDENIITENEQKFISRYGSEILPEHHVLIRSGEACFKATAHAISLVNKYKARLHVLHLCTEKEMSLFRAGDVSEKNITAEVCLHHLYFSYSDYTRKGSLIKWNPSVKYESDRQALLASVSNNKIDTIAGDHAPHLLEEKLGNYFKVKSGATFIQHTLPILISAFKEAQISLATLVQKCCHAPAHLFGIINRGFIQEGYFADVVDVNGHTRSKNSDLLYKCAWSPFENEELSANVKHVFTNGDLVYSLGGVTGKKQAMPVEFVAKQKVN